MGSFLTKRLGAANIGIDDDGFKAPTPKPRPVTTILKWVYNLCSCTHQNQTWMSARFTGLPGSYHSGSSGIPGWQLAGLWQNILSQSYVSARTQMVLCGPHTLELVLLGEGKINRCRHCFSLTHTSFKCRWNPGSQTSSTSGTPHSTCPLKPSEGSSSLLHLEQRYSSQLPLPRLQIWAQVHHMYLRGWSNRCLTQDHLLPSLPRSQPSGTDSLENSTAYQWGTPSH